MYVPHGRGSLSGRGEGARAMTEISVVVRERGFASLRSPRTLSLLFYDVPTRAIVEASFQAGSTMEATCSGAHAVLIYYAAGLALPPPDARERARQVTKLSEHHRLAARAVVLP